MRGYGRDDVEERGEYEDDEEDQYEEYEEGEEEYQEERKPTEEELEYLELRKRLKERYRKNIKKENGSASSKEKGNRLPSDSYGSFFGPSQPVISHRVIQESKSLLETQHLACRVQNSHRNNEKPSASSTSKVGVQRPPPKVNEVQRKLQTLKVSRDYSFLSDDAHVSDPRKEPPARNVSVRNSEARPAQVPTKSKQPLGNNGRNVHGAREERKPVSLNGQTHLRAGVYKSTNGNKSNLMSGDTRKLHSSNNGIGPGRPAGLKAPPSKMPVASVERKPFTQGAKNHLPSAKNHLPSAKNQLPIAKNHLPSAKNQLPIAKNQLPIAKNHLPGPKAPPSSKILPSVQKKHLEQRNGIHEPHRSRPITKQPVASSKSQINKPLKQTSSHAATQNVRPKKKPLRRYSDDEEDEEDKDAQAFSMLRSILGPRKFSHYDDDDDSDMEAGFDDIMQEEEYSKIVGEKEDEEQQRLIEEEERRERMRKLAKKRRLMSKH